MFEYKMPFMVGLYVPGLGDLWGKYKTPYLIDLAKDYLTGSDKRKKQIKSLVKKLPRKLKEDWWEMVETNQSIFGRRYEEIRRERYEKSESNESTQG